MCASISLQGFAPTTYSRTKVWDGACCCALQAGFLTLNIRNRRRLVFVCVRLLLQNYHNMKNKFYLGPCKKRHIETLRDQYFEARKQKRYGGFGLF
ncbi:hypothetical protein EAH_00065680 [Eimeria acervulina]|uniref:Uncharacterized protein n=1 Tax=Eimeria acervulina TaxID=5801 RepID=U6GRT2_EIMAC|nr:hypothetical protein EAH_00065680 [Eimeria acervulina]CDI82277.1 hypothetical protein EAH_00065680 [Eimeria acervulina]